MDLTPVYQFGYDYVEEQAKLDPVGSTLEGITTYNAEVTDYSPDGIEARATFDSESLSALNQLPITNERDRIARDVMSQHLEGSRKWYEVGEPWRELRVIAGVPTNLRSCFDQMPVKSEHDWELIAQRMAGVPNSIEGFIESLKDGVRRGFVTSKRQTLACAEQAKAWGGLGSAEDKFFINLVKDCRFNGSLKKRLDDRAISATNAYENLATFLTQEYLPQAESEDAVGRDRYLVSSEIFLGAQVDPEETYQWGWEEISRIYNQMQDVGKEILPDVAVGEIAEFLNNDSSRIIEGTEPFREWLQALLDKSVGELHGTHFDIPEPIQRVEAMIAPPGGAAAMYYSGPSEDLSLPGRTWYPTQGRTTFPLWHEVTTCYHEGVPGHHLQVGHVRFLSEELSRFQRIMGFISGHGEGWALYAERLMGELGYLDDPAYEFGMLQAQIFRAARIVVDIGLHLELKIPKTENFHPGEVWNPELAFQFMSGLTHQPESFLRSEIDRYLGWAGQAISYKVGERIWLETREAAKVRKGADFNLKEFHSFALNLGPMGLTQLQNELARF